MKHLSFTGIASAPERKETARSTELFAFNIWHERIEQSQHTNSIFSQRLKMESVIKYSQ